MKVTYSCFKYNKTPADIEQGQCFKIYEDDAVYMRVAFGLIYLNVRLDDGEIIYEIDDHRCKEWEIKEIMLSDFRCK